MVTKNSTKIIGLKETKSDSLNKSTRQPYEINEDSGCKKLNINSFLESSTKSFGSAINWITLWKKKEINIALWNNKVESQYEKSNEWVVTGTKIDSRKR